MPEGHTIHRLARDHTRDLAGRPVEVTSPQGRMADAAALVDGLLLARIDPYGKHLFYRFGSPRPEEAHTIHVHLGLFGKFRRHRLPAPEPRDTVRMRIVGSEVAVDLTGPTDCRLLTPDEEEGIRARLGPDPILKDSDPERAWAAIRRRRSTIGEALMDQKVMAGVGNVYRAEALFVHGIHPERPCPEVTREEFDALWDTICSMLRQGVKDNRIITLSKEELAAEGLTRSRVRSKEAVHVYKRDECRRCGTSVDRWDLAGRWAYACRECQS